MSALIRLSYVSESRIEGGPDEQRAAINDIISTAATKNPKLGITGVLMFNAGAFAQILEGPEDAVMALLETITRDERHGEVALRTAEQCTERRFDRWSMGYAGVDTRWMQLFADFVAGGFDESLIARTEIGDVLLKHMLEAEPSLG